MICARTLLSQEHAVAVSGPPFNISCHSYSSDAARSNILQCSKQHTAELTSAYVPDAAALASDPVGQVHRRTQFADIQPVDDGSAAATLSMLESSLLR